MGTDLGLLFETPHPRCLDTLFTRKNTQFGGPILGFASKTCLVTFILFLSVKSSLGGAKSGTELEVFLRKPVLVDRATRKPRPAVGRRSVGGGRGGSFPGGVVSGV